MKFTEFYITKVFTFYKVDFLIIRKFLGQDFYCHLLIFVAALSKYPDEPPTWDFCNFVMLSLSPKSL